MNDVWLQYLSRADTDWLPQHDPGDALQQRRCGERAIIGPVIQRVGQESLGVEVGEVGLPPLRTQTRNTVQQSSSSLIAEGLGTRLYLGLDATQSVQDFLNPGVGRTNLSDVKGKHTETVFTSANTEREQLSLVGVPDQSPSERLRPRPVRQALQLRL